MKSYLIILPIFFFALLQGAFLPLNLVLLAVIVLAAIKPLPWGLGISFWAGFFLDLAKGTTLGLSSMVFLAVAYLLILYRRKFDPYHPLFLPIFVFFSSLLYSRLAQNLWDWREAVILTALVFLVRPLVKYSSASFDQEGIRLKV